MLPFVLVPTMRLGKKIRRITRRAQDDAAELNQILQETLTGHQVVKSFGAEEVESNRFRDRALRLRRSNLRYVAQQAIASPLIEFFAAVTVVGLLTYARLKIKAGAMSTGDFTSFVIALLMLIEPVKRLTGIHNIFQQALGASQKVFEYLDRDRLVKERASAVRLPRFEKSIRFEDAGFRYPTSNGFALDGISLEVRAGEVVALVGPSGAGKSTLVKLLPRFYDVTSGRIALDGIDVRDATLASLRRNIAIVAQEPMLLSGTIADNLRFGKNDATMDEMRHAARLAFADEFIHRLPAGYETEIGERGVKLSGGQKQRLAIARAFLKDAPILILDEPTSALDPESEALIKHALEHLVLGRTALIIAHRLSTIEHADEVVVLDRGRVIERGSHRELADRPDGLYRRYAEKQLVSR
jgi:subfamily B ATP-binding cassette protein MsbA